MCAVVGDVGGQLVSAVHILLQQSLLFLELGSFRCVFAFSHVRDEIWCGYKQVKDCDIVGHKCSSGELHSRWERFSALSVISVQYSGLQILRDHGIAQGELKCPSSKHTLHFDLLLPQPFIDATQMSILTKYQLGQAHGCHELFINSVFQGPEQC